MNIFCICIITFTVVDSIVYILYCCFNVIWERIEESGPQRCIIIKTNDTQHEPM